VRRSIRTARRLRRRRGYAVPTAVRRGSVGLVWPALGQADFAQHEQLTPTSFDWLRMKRRNPRTGVLRARIDAARRDKLRVVPWIPTSVGMSGESSACCRSARCALTGSPPSRGRSGGAASSLKNNHGVHAWACPEHPGFGSHGNASLFPAWRQPGFPGCGLRPYPRMTVGSVVLLAGLGRSALGAELRAPHPCANHGWCG